MDHLRLTPSISGNPEDWELIQDDLPSSPLKLRHPLTEAEFEEEPTPLPSPISSQVTSQFLGPLNQSGTEKVPFSETLGDALKDISNLDDGQNALAAACIPSAASTRLLPEIVRTPGGVVEGGPAVVDKVAEPVEEEAVPAKELPPLTLVLVGKTGNGKSSTGNTLLGEKAFKSKRSAGSVTLQAQVETGVRAGRKVTVIDTPGLFDAGVSAGEVRSELEAAMRLAGDMGGAHAVLFVMSAATKFTAEELACVQILGEVFGKGWLDHTLAVLTHGDELEEEDATLEDFLADSPSALQGVLAGLQGRVLVFNNRRKDAESQAGALFEQVDSLVESHGGETFAWSPALQKEEKAALPIELQSGVGHIGITSASPEATGPGFRRQQLQALERRVKAALVERASMIAWAAGGLVGWKLLACIGMQVNLKSQLTWTMGPQDTQGPMYRSYVPVAQSHSSAPAPPADPPAVYPAPAMVPGVSSVPTC